MVGPGPWSWFPGVRDGQLNEGRAGQQAHRAVRVVLETWSQGRSLNPGRA